MTTKKTFSFVLVLVILFGSLLIAPTDMVEASEAPSYKTFHSINRGNIKAQGEGWILGYIDRKANGQTYMITTRIKQDENQKLAYCLNYNLDSPKFSGNKFKRTNEPLTAKEYTALVYGHGGSQDKTNRSLTSDERYYVSQVAMYAVTNETPEITRDNLIKHMGTYVDPSKSKLILNNINNLLREIDNNTLPLPSVETISIKIEGKTSLMVEKGDYIESSEIQVINSNPKGNLTIDKKELGKAYFVDLEGNKVDDTYVLGGNKVKLRINVEDVAKGGKTGFTVNGVVNSSNIYKYIQSNPEDTGVGGRKIQRIAWIGDIEEKDSDSIFIEYKEVTQDIELIKTNLNGEPLDGAEFELRDKEGNIIQGPSITEDGKIVFKDIPIGEYVIVETKAPEGYVINEDEIPVIVDKALSDPIKIQVENKQIMGGLRIIKKDDLTGEKLAGAKFQIKDENGKVVEEGITNEEGIVEFHNLPYGKYTYNEVGAPEGYILDTEEYDFEIKENEQIIKVELENKKIIKIGEGEERRKLKPSSPVEDVSQPEKEEKVELIKIKKGNSKLESNKNEVIKKEGTKKHLPRTGNNTLNNYFLGLILIVFGLYFRNKNL